MKNISLNKHFGTTKDLKGCEFKYVRYTTIEWVPYVGYSTTRCYVAMGIEAKSLKELKQKISEI